ncbi:ribonuclease H-like domain-containing protein [Tanacetum coccineum]
MAFHDLQWYMDTGATSHLSSHIGNLHTSSLNHNFHLIIVGNGSSIPVTHSGHVQIPNPFRPLHLRNVLVTSNIIKNLVSVRKFTTDNKCSIDFDPYDFTVRDYHTRQTLLRCDNTGDLYPLHVVASAFALPTNNHSIWHQRLGHLGDAGPDTTYLLLYVDDIIFTTSSTSLLQRIISLLHAEFAMTDLGPLNYFFGISATRTTSGIFLSHTKYATEILEQAQMLNFQQLCLYMHDPREPHLNAMKRVLRYPATRRSTSGYYVFLGDNLLTWSSKRQDTLSRSSVEAEYRGVANAVAETSWIRNLLRELHTLHFTATLVYYDNVSAVYMSANPVQHQRTKHIEIDIHFVHDKVAAGHVRVLHVPSLF